MTEPSSRTMILHPNETAVMRIVSARDVGRGVAMSLIKLGATLDGEDLNPTEIAEAAAALVEKGWLEWTADGGLKVTRAGRERGASPSIPSGISRHI